MPIKTISLTIGRRTCVAALTAILLGLASLTQAAAPTPQQQPGYYAMKLGNVRVTALLDGFLPLPLSDLSGIDKDLAQDLVRSAYVPQTAEGLQTAFTAYLIDTGKEQVMIDAGTSQCFGPTLGQVPKQLRAAGYDPAAIDHILITHAHPDHLCGIADASGKPIYPNATVWLADEDAQYWLDPASEKTANAFLKPLFGMARRATAGYIAAGRLQRFKVDARLPAGITLIPTHGHTPGHSSYLVDGGDGQKLLVWGDIVHYHAVQFEHPDAVYAGDSDSSRASAQRLQLFSRAVDGHWWIAGAHLPFPGIGHLNRAGDAFTWVPVEYSPLQ
ncbi:MAG: fold metallo-hydrolase [Hydrocarboniphaga sp.]|uniref:MBL fold metallo-hydrolase n=1 Tax=Hydrocarboniphaga sp. TaxID=2033016 RepID=UPI002631B4D1|nr:MBL fold metallo-hydrolase [Hydrocarboniphaga sp.]MDB5970389.1 fold metallo-hydrolase [Hydrocarboniphaga sp.]